MENELAFSFLVYLNACNIGGHQVRGALQAPEAPAKALRQSFGQSRFSHAWNVLDKDMPGRQESNQNSFHRFARSSKYARDGIAEPGDFLLEAHD